MAAATFLVLLAGTMVTPAGAAGPVLAEYEAIRALQPDGRRSRVDGLVLQRDAFRLELTGTVHYLAPVEGRTPGAVFVGDGGLVVSPAASAERRLLTLRGADALGLKDSFGAAVLLFTDDSEAELLAGGPVEEGMPDAAAGEKARSLLEHVTTEGMDVALSVLRSRRNDEGRGSGAFFALLEGKTLGRAVAAVDPAGILDGEHACLWVTEGSDPGYWYSHGTPAAPALVDVQHYSIDSTVTGGTGLAATTELRLEVRASSLQVVPFELLPTLRVSEAALVGEMPVAVDVVQGPGGSAILLPRALTAGESATLRLRYSGPGVLEDDGVDTFLVEARSNWYPNFGVFKDRATYELTFRVPKDLAVVAVGREVEHRVEGGTLVSVWRAEHPITVAGFNYGDFERYQKREENTGMELEVYASKGTPDVISEINAYLGALTGGTDPRALSQMASDNFTYVDTYSGPSSVGVSTGAVAEAALADAVNSVQVFTQLFGPLDQTRLAMTQQSQWNFGQAWPSLTYLPYLTGVSRMLQMDLGLEGYAGFYDQVGIHEISHQWWGHTVGWASYHDQWLSEGFAELSTALVVELTKGKEAHRAFWNGRRVSVLGRPQGGGTPAYQAGPLTLGFRASTKETPHAYSALAYSKGAYVLHMLRMLMRDHQAAQPDGRFFAMLKDFLTTYRGRDASTEDFKRMVERHMVPELNATRDGKIDWFFDQWVYGTEVPVYSIDVRIEKAEKGKYRIRGTVGQSSVSEDFLTLVGLYVDYGKGQIGQFGRMPFRGTMSRDVDLTVELPKKPKGVLINAEHEVLAFDG